MKSNIDELNQQDVINELSANLESVRQNNDPKELIPSLSKLGLAYLEAGDAPKALTQFDEGLKVAQEQENKEAEAQILGLAGLAIKQIGNYTLAIQKFRKSNRIARSIDHHILVCDSYIQIALLLSEKGEDTKAISQLSRAMTIASDNNDQARRMRIASLMADTFYVLIAFDKAVEYYVLANENPFSSISMRVCGIQFGELTDEQKERIDYFIKEHTQKKECDAGSTLKELEEQLVLLNRLTSRL